MAISESFVKKYCTPKSMAAVRGGNGGRSHQPRAAGSKLKELEGQTSGEPIAELSRERAADHDTVN